MPYRRGYRRRPRRYRRRRLADVDRMAEDIANIQLGSAVKDALHSSHGLHEAVTTKKLYQTNAKKRGRTIHPRKRFGAARRSKYWGRKGYKFGNVIREAGKRDRFRRQGQKKRGLAFGLNKGHVHKFKSHVTGEIFPANRFKAHIHRPLKPYQRKELLFYPHPITQRVLLFGDQKFIEGSDNLLSDRVLYEDFPTVNDKKLLSMSMFPIVPCMNWSGLAAYTRLDLDADSEGFTKVAVVGRQNRCPKENKLDYENDADVVGGSASENTANAVLASKQDYLADPDQILRSVFLKVHTQANRNYAVKVSVALLRMSEPGDSVSNQHLTNDELVIVANSMQSYEYDTCEVVFQQSKVLPPCKSNRFVTESFDIGWSGYAKLTKQFRDTTALTLKSQQGGTYKYGQNMSAKIAGSQLAQGNLSNRYVLVMKCIRLGDSTIGSASQEKEWESGTVKKKVSITQPFNQEDSDLLHETVTGITSADTPALDPYIGDVMTSGSFRCKAELTIGYAVKEAIRHIPVWDSGDNAGQTKILYGSPYDSNYSTLSPYDATQ